MDVNIYNESMECEFQLWKARDKVVAEASFYKMVRQEAVNSNVNYLQWIRINFFLFLDIITDNLVKYKNIKLRIHGQYFSRDGNAIFVKSLH